MFRNFDNWDRYLDNSGKPLRGCVQFMLRDGSTDANIFDSDYTPIANPQLTDVYGRTDKQVFINSDVVAYFYKYIGERFADEEEGDIDTSDVTKWDLQFTVESLSVDERSVSGESAMAVADMGELRSLPVDEVPEIGDRKIVCLQGYYELGDCEPVWYVWDPESTANDDNGGIIKSDERLTGRWLMVHPTEHCDSRHFGVFPQDSADAEIDQQVRITQLVNYCNIHSIRPFFNGSVSNPYFIYDAVRVSSRNPIDVSENTVFVDNGDSAFGGEWNGNPKFLNRQTTVSCKTVRLSWQAKAYPNCIKFIIDTDYPVILSDKIVVMEVNPNSSTQLTRCQVESNRMISGGITMSEMEIREEWFVDGYDWSQFHSFNNIILLENFKTANTYVALKNKQAEADYGDLGEQTLSGVTLLANCIAENASFDNVTLTGNTELHNVSGNVNITGSAYVLNFIDCWLTFNNASNVVLSDIMWRRGAITAGVRVQVLSNLLLEQVDVNAPFFTLGLNPKFYNSAILTQQTIGEKGEFIDCRIDADIVQYPESATYDGFAGYYMAGKFLHNVWTGTAKLSLTPMDGMDYSASTVGVVGKYIGNCSDHDFVVDENWSGVSRGSIHLTTLEYKDNHGGCPESEMSTYRSFNYSQLWQPSDPASYLKIPDGVSGNTGLWVVNDWRSHGEHDIATSVYWVINMASLPLDVSNIWRLKYLKTRYRVLAQCDIQAFLRTDSDGLYTNTFQIRDPLTQSAVDATANVAYIDTVQPLRIEYSGQRQYGNDDIDQQRSALWFMLYNYKNDASRFSASIEIKYTLS